MKCKLSKTDWWSFEIPELQRKENTSSLSKHTLQNGITTTYYMITKMEYVLRCSDLGVCNTVHVKDWGGRGMRCRRWGRGEGDDGCRDCVTCLSDGIVREQCISATLWNATFSNFFIPNCYQFTKNTTIHVWKKNTAMSLLTTYLTVHISLLCVTHSSYHTVLAAQVTSPCELCTREYLWPGV